MWNQGAEENIVTITSKDSGSPSPSDGSSSSADPGLGGGAIAGIVVGCIVAAILVASAIAFIILRRRRKRMSAGFAVAARAPEPDEAVLKGPVFNSPSRHGSTPDSSVPFSAADISASRSRSTAEYIRSGSGTIDESPTGGASTVELDGRDTLIRPDTELDGHEIQQKQPLPPVAENPASVYELPGSGVVANNSKTVDGGTPSTARSSPSREGRAGGSDSPPSPLTSTVSRSWGLPRHSVADSELVSPDTPIRRNGGGPF